MAHRSAPVVVTRRAGSGRGDPGRRGIDSSARLAIVLCCVVLLQMSFFGRMQLRSMRAVRDDQKIAGWDRVVSPRSLARIPYFPLSPSLSLTHTHTCLRSLHPVQSHARAFVLFLSTQGLSRTLVLLSCPAAHPTLNSMHLKISCHSFFYFI